MEESLDDSCRPTVISDLPVVVMEKIIAFFTYEEISKLRQVSKFFQKYAERALNDGFGQLGREVTHSAVSLKKLLPKKESERRVHPLNRYSEVFSALETRYTLLSMTYKKYIDLRYCCFIPGKVLDIAFSVIRQTNTYLLRNTPVILDVIQLLKDIRDYSSMAMEHFDEHIATRFPNKTLLPLVQANSSGEAFGQNWPFCSTRRLSLGFSSNANNDKNGSDPYGPLKQEFKGKLDEQNRVIEEQKKMIEVQGQLIRQIVDFLGEMGKQNEWAPGLMNNLNKISSRCTATAAAPFTSAASLPMEDVEKNSVKANKTKKAAQRRMKAEKQETTFAAPRYNLRGKKRELNSQAVETINGRAKKAKR